MSSTTNQAELTKQALKQIRDGLATLSYAADGWYEDEAQVALDALDWLEDLLRRDGPTDHTAGGHRDEGLMP